MFDKIASILSDMYGVSLEDIKPESELYGDLDLDSLDQVEIAMECEDIFKIEFNESEFDKITTVQDLANTLERILANAGKV